MGSVEVAPPASQIHPAPARQSISWLDVKVLGSKPGYTNNLAYLAFCQHSDPPYLHVTSSEEKKRCQEMFPAFLNRGALQAEDMAAAFNSLPGIGAGNQLFRKTTYHMEFYYAEYKMQQLRLAVRNTPENVLELQQLEWSLRTSYYNGLIPWDEAGQQMQRIWEQTRSIRRIPRKITSWNGMV